MDNTQRSNSLKAAIHIANYSNADPLEKINAIVQALHPDDAKAIESAISSTLKQLIQKA